MRPTTASTAATAAHTTRRRPNRRASGPSSSSASTSAERRGSVKLYASANSSFARKIRVMLIEKNVRHDVEMLNLWEPNDLQHANPIGKVPALKLDDGRVLITSPLI